MAFVDVVLGDEDGIVCRRRLKAVAPTTCVTLISAHSNREFYRRGMEAGAVALLDKKELDVASMCAVMADMAQSAGLPK